MLLTNHRFTDKAAVRSDAAAELDRLTRGAQKKPNSGNNSLDNNINSTSECWRMACKEEKEGDGVSSLYLLLCASKKRKTTCDLMVLDAQLTKKSHLKNMKCKFVVRCRRRLCQLVVTQKQKLIKTLLLTMIFASWFVFLFVYQKTTDCQKPCHALNVNQ